MIRISPGLWKGTLAVLFAALIGINSAPGSAGAAEVESIQITVTDGGYAVRPEIAAGQYRIMIENLSGQRVDLMLVRVPDGMSATEMQAVLVTGTSKRACGAIEQSTLESTQSPGMIPLGQAAPHSQSTAVVSLVPGAWVVMSGYPGIDSMIAEFTVGSAG